MQHCRGDDSEFLDSVRSCCFQALSEGHHHKLFDFSDRSNAEGASGDSKMHCESSRGIDIDQQRNQDIDRQSRKNIDRQSHIKNQGELVPEVTSDMSDAINHGKKISGNTYTTLVIHQFKLECLGARLQNLENTTATMNEKWRRGDETMRDFTGTWFNKSIEEMETCFPTSTCFLHY